MATAGVSPEVRYKAAKSWCSLSKDCPLSVEGSSGAVGRMYWLCDSALICLRTCGAIPEVGSVCWVIHTTSTPRPARFPWACRIEELPRFAQMRSYLTRLKWEGSLLTPLAWLPCVAGAQAGWLGSYRGSAAVGDTRIRDSSIACHRSGSAVSASSWARAGRACIPGWDFCRSDLGKIVMPTFTDAITSKTQATWAVLAVLAFHTLSAVAFVWKLHDSSSGAQAVMQIWDVL